MTDEIHTGETKHDYFRICGTCFRLYETGRPDGDDQRCDCSTGEEERWPHVDFNEHACLCACCGTVVLESGSRWSPFFCRECQLLAMGVSLWERRLVFPIGRHSLMHTWVPHTKAPSLAAHAGRTDLLAKTVLGAVTVMSAGHDARSQWSASIVARHLKRLRLRGGTKLAKYLAALEHDKKAPTRWALFAEFCEFIRTPSQGPETVS